MRSSFLTAASTGVLATLVQSHIILETPRPYKFAAYGPSNPLDPSGSDFPCKIPPGVARLEIDGSPTVMAIGEPQTLSFAPGYTAVHGGGSCQVSLTPSFSPNKSSKFQVIHSIVGGCPKANIAGNLEEKQTADKYQYVIPDGIGPGEYTLAWTWINRIGGPDEMYMNCAPIVVTAGNSTLSRQTNARKVEPVLEKQVQFPFMFMANLGVVANGCTTTSARAIQHAIAYPHPGTSVDYPEGTAKLFIQQCDGNSLNSGAVVSPMSSVAGSAGTAVAPPVSTAKTSLPVSIDTLTTLTTIGTSSSISPPKLSSTSEASETFTRPPSTSTALPTGSCIDGQLLCLVTHFATCTGGQWTAVQPLAPGTTCTGGAGVGLTIVNPA